MEKGAEQTKKKQIKKKKHQLLYHQKLITKISAMSRKISVPFPVTPGYLKDL